MKNEIKDESQPWLANMTEDSSSDALTMSSNVTSYHDNTTVTDWLMRATTWVNQTVETFIVGGATSNNTLTSSHLTELPATSSVMSSTVMSPVTVMSSITEETYTGDDRPLLIHASSDQDSHNMAPLGLLAVVIITVIGNTVMCLAVKMDRHLHHMTYYFLVSMGVLHMVMSAVVMPPAILIILTGEFNRDIILTKSRELVTFPQC